MKRIDIKHLSAENISQKVFYLLIGLAAIIFLLFFLVGYDMPFEENPDFTAPLFTDVLIVFMVMLFCLALVAIGISVWTSFHESQGLNNNDGMTHQVPRRKIARFVWGGTFMLLLLTFLLGSSSPMLVNGTEFVDWAWLKVSDMFVLTSLLLLLCAIVVVAFGATRYIRKKGNRTCISEHN